MPAEAHNKEKDIALWASLILGTMVTSRLWAGPPSLLPNEPAAVLLQGSWGDGDFSSFLLLAMDWEFRI